MSGPHSPAPDTHAPAVTAAFSPSRPRGLPLADAGPGSPHRPVTSSAPGSRAHTLFPHGPRLLSRLPQRLSRSRNSRLRPPSAPWGRRRRQLLPVEVVGAETSSGDMEALGQSPACGIPGRDQRRATRQSPVLNPGLHSIASRPGQARNLSSGARVSARAEGRISSSATSGPSCFNPRSRGFSRLRGENQLL